MVIITLTKANLEFLLLFILHLKFFFFMAREKKFPREMNSTRIVRDLHSIEKSIDPNERGGGAWKVIEKKSFEY